MGGRYSTPHAWSSIHEAFLSPVFHRRRLEMTRSILRTTIPFMECQRTLRAPSRSGLPAQMPQLEAGITSEEEHMEIHGAQRNGKTMNTAQPGRSLIEGIVALGKLVIAAAGGQGLGGVPRHTTGHHRDL